MGALSARIESFRHDDAEEPALRDASLAVGPGEILAVTGPSGSGKSTLGQILAGMLPADGGTLRGELSLDGNRLAFDGGPAPAVDRAAWGRLVGFLPQDVRLYLSGARATVAEEIAFGLEYRGVPRAEQRRAVAGTLERLGLEHLVDRDPLALSGGQERLVALAALLVLRPGTVVLDEPGAGLDGAALERLAEAVRALAARGSAVVLLAGDGEPLADLADRRLALGRPETDPDAAETAGAEAPDGLPAADSRTTRSRRPARPGPDAGPGEVLLELRDFSVTRSGSERPVVRGADLTLRAGECLAVTGPNGVGKTTLLRGVLGLERSRGVRRFRGRDLPARPARAARDLAVMFQNPADQLTETSAAREIRAVLPRAAPEEIERVLAGVGLAGLAGTHPYELPAAGKRLLCLAQVLARGTRAVLLDEPGVGLDAAGRRILVARLREAAAEGVGILLVTHDRALVEELADREHPLGEESGPHRS